MFQSDGAVNSSSRGRAVELAMAIELPKASWIQRTGRPARWSGRYAAGADHGCRAAGTSGDARPASPGPNIHSACGGRSRACAWRWIMHHAPNGCSTGHATVIVVSRIGTTLRPLWSNGGLSMADTALQAPPIEPAAHSSRPNLDKGFNPISLIIFGGIMAAGLLFVAYSVYADVDASGTQVTDVPALPAAVRRAADRARLRVRQRLPRHRQRGRHRHLHPFAAGRDGGGVVGRRSTSSACSLSTGAVAFGIISLLPVELILQVGSSAGFAMVFALLIAAIIWNLGTWWLGLPASSSHTLIGSIIGVGIANALMRGRDGTSGVDWTQGDRDRLRRCCCRRWSASSAAALLLLALKFLVRNPALYDAPEGQPAAALVDSRHPDPDLHRRQLRARLERRAEGHGPDHADPDRHGADRLCAEPRACPRARCRIRQRGVDRSRGGDREAGGRLPRAGRSAAAPSRVYVSQRKINEGTFVSLAALVKRDLGPGRPVRLARQGPGRRRRQHRATTCTSPPRRCAS